jgi:DNA polymerase-4
MAIFSEHTEIIEPLSLDEAFLDVTENFQNQPSATIIANEIRQKIYSRLGLTSSAGVSYNKFIAKIASDVNKPNGIKTVPPEAAVAFIANLPIGKFFGVGKVTEKKMFKLGIQKGADLFQFDLDLLTFHFGKSGRFLYNIVRGIDDRPVEPQRERKSIGSETTLSKDTNDIMEINAILATICDKIATVLTKKQCGGYTLTLKIRYHDFVTISRSHTVRTPMFNRSDIQNVLPRLLYASNIGNKPVRLLGLSISKLVDSNSGPIQLPLPFISPIRLDLYD